MYANRARWRGARWRAATLALGLVAITACTSLTSTRYRSLGEDYQRFAAPREPAGGTLGEAEAASDDFDAVRLRRATMASLLFDDDYLAARSLEINAEHVAHLQEFQRIATVRHEVGEASQQDPIQVEVPRWIPRLGLPTRARTSAR